MTRDEAFKVVRQHGGMPSETVTKRTKLLVVGELGWPLLDDGRPSNKLSRATAYGIRSILAICFVPTPAMLKPKRHCEPRPELIRHSWRLGTI
jgi:hypothetical protein